MVNGLVFNQRGSKMVKTITTAYTPILQRKLQSVGKRHFVVLAGKLSKNRLPSLKSAVFTDGKTGKTRSYTRNTVYHKSSSMKWFDDNDYINSLLFDIYFNPSCIEIGTRKLAGRYYKRLTGGAKLPPMVMKKRKK